MIKKLTIENFKSIKNLTLQCKRVNIFIGEPNTGKSNILEALSLLNETRRLSDFVRFDHLSQIFYDFDSLARIKISADTLRAEAWISMNTLYWVLLMDDTNLFRLNYNLKGENIHYEKYVNKEYPIIRYYKYTGKVQPFKSETIYLEPPDGANIGTVLLYNKGLRVHVQDILEDMEFKLLFKPDDSSISIYKEQNGFSIAFPYSIMSDTVRRMMFYLAAVESNNKATLLFEEPESNTFPYYIGYLAERISKFSDNQFFITTHNPYFFIKIIEKTPREDLTVNVVQMKDYQTKVKQLSDREVEEALSLNADVFLNFDKLLEHDIF